MAPPPGKKLIVKMKVWIEDQDSNMVFGMGRLRILEAVQHKGSILAAAKELGMSYRAVWGKIKATEERLGQPLLMKQIGGLHGGGSELTPFAQALVASFRQLQTVAKTTSDALFQGLFLPGVADQLITASGEDEDPPLPK